MQDVCEPRIHHSNMRAINLPEWWKRTYTDEASGFLVAGDAMGENGKRGDDGVMGVFASVFVFVDSFQCF